MISSSLVSHFSADHLRLLCRSSLRLAGAGMAALSCREVHTCTTELRTKFLVSRCVCLLLQYLLQSCSRGGRGIVPGSGSADPARCECGRGGFVVGRLCWLGARPGLPCPDFACGGRAHPAEAGLGLHCRSEFGLSGTG